MSLVDVASLSPRQIESVLDRAAEMRELGRTTQYAGRTVVPMFFEPSTRTRMSFDLAATNLGAQLLAFDHKTSSATKGETLRDTARTVGAMGPDLLIVRHVSAGAPEAVQKWSGKPVLNAGDGRRAHPTQTLSDLLVIRDRFGDFSGVHVGLVGDIVNSRVARGLLSSFPRLGGRVTAIGPSTFVPRAGGWQMSSTSDFDSIIGELDVVYLLRVQKERGGGLGYPSDGEFHRRFGLNQERSHRLKPDCVIMHPGPINRGVEVSSDVADGPSSVILDQVAAGVPIRMAAIAMTLDGHL